jgi:D-alanyl-D-alanine carboxypeptidase/D-alanyl-D-alanine-endopeptidase (penicillin-binding protein 4)
MANRRKPSLNPSLFLSLVFPGLLLAHYVSGGTASSSAPPLTGRAELRSPRVSGPLSTTDPEVQELRRDLESILTSTGNRTGRWGVLAVSLDRGDTLVAMNADELMVPASNMKLLSTAAALHFLGPRFTFRTFLLADGPQSGRILDGDLVLFGTGDPTFSERYFSSELAPLDSLARQLADSGIEEVAGNLVVDGSYFRGPELHPDWDPEDLNDAFAAPVSALSIAENVVTVRVQAGAWVGAEPSIFTIPDGAGLPITNLARTTPAGTRSRVWLFRETPADPIGIEGEMPQGAAEVWRRLPVPDPLLFTGRQMRKALERRGVRIRGEIVVNREEGISVVAQSPAVPGQSGESPPKILASVQSGPLIDILRVINKESNNFLAETVTKVTGRIAQGNGSFFGGKEAVKRFLVDEVGIGPDDVLVRDGSGLSEGNQASAGVFVKTLEFMAASTHWEDFLETLPEAGVRRELGRMYRSPAARNLRAKTGTMDRVSALSGIVRTRAGERILFSILSNEVASEYRAKRAEDRFGIRLASLTRSISGEAGASSSPHPSFIKPPG